MSKTLLISAALALCAPLAMGQGMDAEIEKPSRFSVGAVFPGDSDLTDRTGDIHYSLGYAYDFFQSERDMNGNFWQGGGYFDFTYGEDDDNELITLGLGAQGRYYFGDEGGPVAGYAGAGLGVYWVDYKYAGPPVIEDGGGDGIVEDGGDQLTQLAGPVEDDEIKLGGKLFVGLETPSGFFAQADYTIIGEVVDTAPGGFGLRVGLRF
jgi:hypothetical protein